MSNYRDDFPFIVRHPETAYFDNAATTLKPQMVIDAVVNYYENLGANVHRGDFRESLETSALFENVRDLTASFIGAQRNEIIFTSGASESLNLMAHMVASLYLGKGDVVLLNEAEHASNILPWYALAHDFGFTIEFIPLEKEGSMEVDTVMKAIHPGVKVMSLAHISNVLGMAYDLEAITRLAHEHNIIVCVDGAQAIGHTAVDVQQLDVDFYAFSAHKMLGPSGVGVLYGKIAHLDAMPPLKMGGGSNVRFDNCGNVTLKTSPAKFESGTPNIEGVLGFGAALQYLETIGFEYIQERTETLRKRLVDGLKPLKHIKVLNPDADVSIVSLNVEGIFAQDVAAYLDRFHISVRAGDHCAKLLNGAIHQEKSVRVSLYFYNNEAEVDRLVEVLSKISLEDVIADFV